jgi:hypothetical protein
MSTMTKQKENYQMTGEEQVLEQVPPTECEQELNEEALAEIAGAGLGTARHGRYIAELYGGNAQAQAKSYAYGLAIFDRKNGSYKTYDYAVKQAAANPKK